MSAIERYEGSGDAVERWDAKLAMLERTAAILARSVLVPRAFRGKPQEIVAAGLSLIAVGVDPSPMSLKQCFVVDGSVNFMAQLQIALMQHHGHELRFPHEECDATKATCRIRLAGQDHWHTFVYTLDRARRAGLLDSYVESDWVEGAGKRRFVVAVDGVPTGETPPAWAQKLIDKGSVRSKEPWFTSRESMLMCRAGTLAIGKVCPGVLFGLSAQPPPPPPRGAPDPGPVALDETDDASITDAEVIEHEADDEAPEAPAGADTLSHEGRARIRAQTVRNAIHAAKARIPAGQWKAAAAAAWRRAGLPAGGALDLEDDQIETATLLVRQYLVLAALDAAGITDPVGRHTFINAATDGETESSKALTKAQFEAVMAAIEDGVGEPEPELAEQLEASLFAAGGDPADDGRPFE